MPGQHIRWLAEHISRTYEAVLDHSQRTATLLAAFATLLAGSLAAAAPVAGQTVHGRVVDDATATPVAGAVVVLRSGAAAYRAESDAAGQFRIRAERAGAYTLEASHPYYLDVRTLYVTLGAAEEREVLVRLRRDVVVGDTLVAEVDVRAEASFEGAMARYRTLPGYGFRRVVTHNEPELRNSMKLSEVLRWFPTGSCTIMLHNGMVARGEADMWHELPADAVEAVEFYRFSYQAPPGLREIAMVAAPGADTAGCAIVALWSRRTPTGTQRPLLKLLGTAAASVLLIVLLR